MSIAENKSAPPPATRWRVGQIIWGCFAWVAAISLLYQNAGPTAPAWQMLAGRSPQLSIEHRLATADQLFLAQADGHPLALHFSGFDPIDPDQGLLVSELYYRAVYALYPLPVYVGHPERLIRYPVELLDASSMEDDAWYSSQGVKTVLAINRLTDGRIVSLQRDISAQKTLH